MLATWFFDKQTDSQDHSYYRA